MKIPKEPPKKGSANKAKLDRRFFIIKRDGAKCNYCGNTDANTLTVDHIIPKSQGGTEYIQNLQILCKRCHRKKDRYVPLENRLKGYNQIISKKSKFKGTLWYEEHK